MKSIQSAKTDRIEPPGPLGKRDLSPAFPFLKGTMKDRISLTALRDHLKLPLKIAS